MWFLRKTHEPIGEWHVMLPMKHSDMLYRVLLAIGVVLIIAAFTIPHEVLAIVKYSFSGLLFVSSAGYGFKHLLTVQGAINAF